MYIQLPATSSCNHLLHKSAAGMDSSRSSKVAIDARGSDRASMSASWVQRCIVVRSQADPCRSSAPIPGSCGARESAITRPVCTPYQKKHNSGRYRCARDFLIFTGCVLLRLTNDYMHQFQRLWVLRASGSPLGDEAGLKHSMYVHYNNRITVPCRFNH